jgi:phytol kinase
LTGGPPGSTAPIVGDAARIAFWLLALGAGLGACVLLRRAGAPAGRVRDLLHVGAGVWVVGWPAWSSPIPPAALAAAVAAGMLLVPLLARRWGLAERLLASVSGGDEGWAGVALYGASFAAFTWLGLVRGPPFPAGAALLALALGDGLGGAVGRRFGRHRFTAPFAKARSLEGSAAVSVLALAGVALAAVLLGARPGAPAVALAGLAAGAAEAVAPRASDNALVPIAVYAVLSGLG